MPQHPGALELLERYLPVLRYDSQGSFMADSPAILTNRVAPSGHAANALKRADGTILASARGGRRRARLDLGFLGFPQYGSGAGVERSDYLDAVGRDYVDQARDMHRGEFADRIYGRAIEADDGGWWLQYWFFYLYNDKAFLGVGLHEGDWEMVQVRTGPAGRASAMACAQHSHGQRARWGRVEKHQGRPVIYVARGSQASYMSRGRHDAPLVPDYANGEGPQVVDATLERIGDSSPAWVAWPGRWGSTKARSRLESNSPRGPAHQDKWGDPETFHQECDEVGRARAMRALPPAGPRSPEISVRRDGDRAVIDFRIPRPAGPAGAPARLIVTLDSPDDQLPPATYTETVEGRSGTVEHPLPLEDKRYKVLASVADERGNTSAPARARLRAGDP